MLCDLGSDEFDGPPLQGLIRQRVHPREEFGRRRDDFHWGSGREVEAAGGADGGLGKRLAVGGSKGDLVADDGAEVGVGVFLAVAVTAAAIVEIRTVADVALVLSGPADEAVVTVFRLHGFMGGAWLPEFAAL